MNPRFFRTPAAFSRWLEKNHDKETELWVGFYKKSSGKPSITWPEARDRVRPSIFDFRGQQTTLFATPRPRNRGGGERLRFE